MKIVVAIVSLWVLVLFPVPAASETSKNCHVALYRLKNGRKIDIAPSDVDRLHWLMFTGERGELRPRKDGTWASTYGWTGRPDGKTISFSDCAHRVPDTAHWIPEENTTAGKSVGNCAWHLIRRVLPFMRITSGFLVKSESAA